MEQFKTTCGKIYVRPSGQIATGDTVAIISEEKKTIEIVGSVDSIKRIGNEAWCFVDVGGADPVPRKINELAVPLLV